MELFRQIIRIIREFQEVGHAFRIERPNEFISTKFHLPKKFAKVINCSSRKIVFTRRSLKHISEKDKIQEWIPMTFQVLFLPNLILKSVRNRYLFSKVFHKNERPLPLVVVLEVREVSIIVTTFFSNEKYLKNFKILWRTETRENCPSIEL